MYNPLDDPNGFNYMTNFKWETASWVERVFHLRHLCFLSVRSLFLQPFATIYQQILVLSECVIIQNWVQERLPYIVTRFLTRRGYFRQEHLHKKDAPTMLARTYLIEGTKGQPGTARRVYEYPIGEAIVECGHHFFNFMCCMPVLWGYEDTQIAAALVRFAVVNEASR